MAIKNTKLSDYSEQVAAGVPTRELTDWSKVPEKIIPKTQKTRGPKTKIQHKKLKNGYYPEEVRVEAVALYAALGNVAEVGRMMGIGMPVLRSWKQTEWWHEMLNRIHDEKDEELDSKFSKTIDLALTEIEDRLVNGEYVQNAKTGQISRVKPKMRDVAYVTSMQIDKRQLLRGKPTSRTEKISQNNRLENLAKEFAKFVGAKEIVQDANEQSS